MAVLGHGMQVLAGAGVGWMQFRVVTTPYPSWVITGLVPAGASLADGESPGRDGGTVGPSGGWGGLGYVDWTLPGPAPARDVVKFGQGDRVMVVLDCRQGPLVRLLVNSRLRQVHHLALPTGGPIVILCPAIAVNCWDGRAATVEVEAEAPLPDGWDSDAPAEPS